MGGRRRLLGAAAAAAACAAVGGTTPRPATAANPAQVFTPLADAFVSAAEPKVNYGRARSLQLRARPLRRAYLRFRIGGLRGGVVSARLRVFVTRPARANLQVRVVARRRW